MTFQQITEGQLIIHSEKSEIGPLPYTTHWKKKKRIPNKLFKDENFTYNVGKYLYDLGGGKDFFNKIQKNIK